jgi:MFS family permease
MIEVYAFLAMFAVQILAMSVLFPSRLIKYSREQTSRVYEERLAQLYPGVDQVLLTEQFFTRIRVGSTGVAVIGMLALGWLYGYMRQPDWSLGAVIALNSVYFMLQFVPLLLAAWFAYRLFKKHEQSPSEGKRTATLERRRLFDYVSPSVVFLAALAYVMFVALVMVFQRESFPGLFLIGVLSLVYAIQARDVYKALYGKKQSPLDTHTVRTNRTAFAVRFGIYMCIVIAVFFSFTFMIDVLDQKKWVPFALSVLFVTIALLISTGITALIRKRNFLSEVPS